MSVIVTILQVKCRNDATLLATEICRLHRLVTAHTKAEGDHWLCAIVGLLHGERSHSPSPRLVIGGGHAWFMDVDGSWAPVNSKQSVQVV